MRQQEHCLVSSLASRVDTARRHQLFGAVALHSKGSAYPDADKPLRITRRQPLSNDLSLFKNRATIGNCFPEVGPTSDEHLKHDCPSSLLLVEPQFGYC